MDHPKVNWFGGMLVTRELLAWSKGGVEDDGDRDSFVSKMNRPNLIQRVMLVMQVLNAFGPTLQAAQTIQADGKGFFTDVSAESLAAKLAEAVERLKSGGIWKFGVAELGRLQFQTDEASQPDETA